VAGTTDRLNCIWFT